MTSDFETLALENQQSASWAVFQVQPVHKIVRSLHEDGALTSQTLSLVLKEFGFDDARTGQEFRNILGKDKLGIIECTDDTWRLTSEARPGMCSGAVLADLWREEDWNPSSNTARNRLACNFMIYAPEFMQVLDQITPFGVPGRRFKAICRDTVVFGTKLSGFKIDNVLVNLLQLDILSESNEKFVIKNVPTAAALLWRTHAYLAVTGYALGEQVPCEEVDMEFARVIPRKQGQFEDQPEKVGLPRHFPYPFTLVRGKTHYRLDEGELPLLLERRLLSPVSVVRILRKRATFEDINLVKKLRDNFVAKWNRNEDGRPRNYDELLEEYDA